MQMVFNNGVAIQDFSHTKNASDYYPPKGRMGLRRSVESSMGAGASVAKPNSDALNYMAVEKAIFSMAKLPASHDLKLDDQVAHKAASVLRLLQDSFASAPKVINEEGDAVVFTWQSGGVKQYLSVSLSEIALQARRLGTPFSAEEVISEGEQVDVGALVRLFGARVNSSSANGP